MKALNLTGKRFGRLVAISRGPATKFKHSTWNCLCDCGKKHRVETLRLRDGRTTSCGCFAIEIRGKAQLRHGECVGGISPTYAAWQAAKGRCEQPNNTAYPRYGGRGIKVCKRWSEDFAAFLADMGERPDGKTLDRYPNQNGHYEPGNCRWATVKEQNRNKRNNINVTLEDGTTVVLKDFATMHGINYHCMYARYVRGQPLLKSQEPS